MYEEFYTSDDEINLDKFESIGVIKNSYKPNYLEVESVVNQMSELFSRESYNKQDMINIMNNLLPNFSHIETGKSLDQKM